ncbi:ABC transporter related protein [Ferroglobus placidus DSM 10642]|uniref:Molybdate/tungstate import ATP-binding protein WtpC n=1 Tax=Ferroglobus placidus (strain DSM 10642 / AEDII12DO) TaxID=589924 RepID=D3RZI3_FERPA|nr:ABC transporter ATP-binding protein [Ferroglobus placidus]ADC65896.1 ABC transporter related protein [Ferroglobus placidus DSM 10642]
MALEIRNVKKSFGDLKVLDGVSFEVEKGEFACIVGESGCGKTTLLKIVAGLVKADEGEVLYDGRELKTEDIAFVFQDDRLLPWRTALENVMFSLEMRMRELDKKRREEIAKSFLELVGLKGFENYYPHQLSGGMRQRVGICRALAVNPKVLLMDEPFASLDAQTRNRMQLELLRIWERERKTILFVTHSVDEAVFLADKVVVLSPRPTKVLKVLEINLERPRDRTSPEFIGYRREIINFLQGSSFLI